MRSKAVKKVIVLSVCGNQPRMVQAALAALREVKIPGTTRPIGSNTAIEVDSRQEEKARQAVLSAFRKKPLFG